ncbi:MAG: DegT/DnrJ/EryC1/StrS aminotransferase family protein [Pyrinomonadaceae bacterium]
MNPIQLSSPNITEQDIGAVVDVLRSGMLVQDKNVEALEEAVADHISVRNVIAASSGTATLHLALAALGVKAGDQVIVPALSHVATANVVELIGAECVFVDVERDTFNIDVSKIEAVLTPRTRAIMPVHEFGLACDILPIAEIAKHRNLFLIEDAACALGTVEDKKHVGTFGNVGSFSLHPRKAITSGEGGLLATDDDDLARRFRILRNHGIETRQGVQQFVEAGFNYRLTDFQAAMALSQFGRLEDGIRRRRSLADIYQAELGNEEKLQLPLEKQSKVHAWQTFHVVVDGQLDRDRLIRDLKKRGIATNYGAQCIPATTYYRQKYGFDCERLFPNALRAFTHGLALPLHEKLTDDDIKYVSNTLRELLT